LVILAVALFAYSTALVSGVNGFVAAFLAGLAFGTVVAEDEVVGFTEESGTLMSLLVWFLFGAVMVVPGFEAASWRDVVFALLALTVVRMAPVALALAGSGCDRSTVAFIGWFGPRGLASVVFGLIATDTLLPADGDLVLGAVTVTVTLSVALHGASASPLAKRYGQIASRLPPGPEHRLVEPVSTRKMVGGPRFFRPPDQS
jgi:NhaP-type Na+/H+ or K+/H+ antiporter